MKLAQVLGTNGAGKSTVLRTIAQMDNMAQKIEAYTVCHTPRLVLIGDYLDIAAKTPGADKLRGKEDLLNKLDRGQQVAEHYGYNLAWEGIIIMTRQYHPEYLKLGMTPVYFVLDISNDDCFARIEQRSGKKRADLKGNGKIVVSRARGVERLAQWFAAQHSRVVKLPGTAAPGWLAARVVEELK